MAQKTQELPAVLGIGNALVDIMVLLEDDKILKDFGLPRGSMTLVDEHLSEKIFRATESNRREIKTGGSVANSIHALACLGGDCGYIGKIGRDSLGEKFKKEFEELEIKIHLHYSDTATGRVMAMVSPDSERTMATYLGAALELLPGELDQNIFDSYLYFYVEGYLVQNHELIRSAVLLAKAAGLKVAIDLSSYNIVAENLGFLKELISRHVDIVFANEEEALAYTGFEPEKALEELAAQCEIAVVKIGKEGSLIKSGDEFARISPVNARAIDTTGAGDNYAAGFFYGLTHGLSLEKCGRIAAFVSGKAVEVTGARLPDSAWAEIKTAIDKIIQE